MGILVQKNVREEIITNPYPITEGPNAWGHRLRWDWEQPTETGKDTVSKQIDPEEKEDTTPVSDTRIATSCQGHFWI